MLGFGESRTLAVVISFISERESKKLMLRLNCQSVMQCIVLRLIDGVEAEFSVRRICEFAPGFAQIAFQAAIWLPKVTYKS